MSQPSESPGVFHALVTGATGGIGRGVCDALAEMARAQGRQPRLSIVGSQAGARLDAAARELRAAGIETVPLAGDLTDPAACRGIVEQALASGGDLHALVAWCGGNLTRVSRITGLARSTVRARLARTRDLDDRLPLAASA